MARFPVNENTDDGTYVPALEKEELARLIATVCHDRGSLTREEAFDIMVIFDKDYRRALIHIAMWEMWQSGELRLTLDSDNSIMAELMVP